jgi:hypothetical protein
MSAPFAQTARATAVALGGYLGFILGGLVAYHRVDHGDVGSAAEMVLWCPVGILIGSISAYVIATKTLRRFLIN